MLNAIVNLRALHNSAQSLLICIPDKDEEFRGILNLLRSRQMRWFENERVLFPRKIILNLKILI